MVRDFESSDTEIKVIEVTFQKGALMLKNYFFIFVTLLLSRTWSHNTHPRIDDCTSCTRQQEAKQQEINKAEENQIRHNPDRERRYRIDDCTGCTRQQEAKQRKVNREEERRIQLNRDKAKKYHTDQPDLEEYNKYREKSEQESRSLNGNE